MVIIDTSVWIDYLGGHVTPQGVWLETQMTRQRLGITDLILSEVLQGIRDDKAFRLTLQELSAYQVFSMGGADLAIAAAQNFRLLRARGYTVRKTIDCWIATFCLLNDHALLHNDKDFQPFEQVLGLMIIRG